MRQKGFNAILALVIIIIVGVVGYLGYKNFAVIQSAIETKNWKNYTNTTYKLSFKYPSDYKFEETTLNFPNVAWMSSLESPRNIVNEDTKVWNVFAISVAVRGKRGLSFDQWINDECGNKIKSKNGLVIQGRQAAEVICSLGSTNDNQEINWKIIAIDNGDYIYTLTDNAYQRNSEIDTTFSQLVPTFKFTQ